MSKLFHKLSARTRATMKRGALIAAVTGAVLGILLGIVSGFEWPWETIFSALVYMVMLGSLGLIIGGYLGIIFGTQTTRPTAIRGVFWGSIAGLSLGFTVGSFFGLMAYAVNSFSGTSATAAFIFVTIISVISTLAGAFLGATIGALVGILRARVQNA